MSRQNLCTNPKAKTDTSDWLQDIGTLSRVTSWSGEGIASPTLSDPVVSTGFKLVSALSGGYQRTSATYQFDLPASHAEHYTLHLLLYTSHRLNSYVELVQWDNDTDWNRVGSAIGYADTDDSWCEVRIPVAVSTDATFFILYLASVSASSHTNYVTAVMLEPTLSSDGYKDGDSEGWAYNVDGSSYQSSASATTVPDFLDAMQSKLDALVALDGVNVYTGPVDPVAMGAESIVLATEPFDVAYEYQTMPRTETYETYAVQGFIWMVKPGANEAAIKAARDRAYAILEAVHDYVASLVGKTATQAALGVDHVKVSGHNLEQLVGDGERHVFLRFTVEADAYFTPA